MLLHQTTDCYMHVQSASKEREKRKSWFLSTRFTLLLHRKLPTILQCFLLKTHPRNTNGRGPDRWNANIGPLRPRGAAGGNFAPPPVASRQTHFGHISGCMRLEKSHRPKVAIMETPSTPNWQFLGCQLMWNLEICSRVSSERLGKWRWITPPLHVNFNIIFTSADSQFCRVRVHWAIHMIVHSYIITSYMITYIRCIINNINTT